MAEINSLPRIPTVCPSCTRSTYQVIRTHDFRGLQCRNVICKNCGLIYINPVMTEESYRIFYEKYYRTSYQHYRPGPSVEKYFKTEVREGKAFIAYLRSTGYDPKGKAVLDIGCGAGGAVKAFQDYGCESSGVDYNQDYIEYGKKFSLDLRTGGIGDIVGKWDIIILSHLIEHLLYPVRDLKKILTHLKEDGIVFVQTPGVLNLKYASYDLNADYEVPHVCNYTLRTLTNTMKRAGYSLRNGDEGINAIFFVDSQPFSVFDSDYLRVSETIERAKQNPFKASNRIFRFSIFLAKSLLPKKLFFFLRRKYLHGK